MTNPGEDPLALPQAPAAAGGEDARLALASLGRFLGRRWLVLLLVAGALLAAVWAYARSLPRVYSCTPAVVELVQELPSSARGMETYEYALSAAAYYLVPTQVAVLSTSQVLDPVVEELGLRGDPDYGSLAGLVVATARENTTLISLTVQGPSPERNARIANAVARRYSALRQAERDERLEAGAKDAERQVEERSKEVRAADDELQRWRVRNQVSDVKAAEETARARLAGVFAQLKAAEAEVSRAQQAEAQVLAAERDGRSLGDLGVVREGEEVRRAEDELRRAEQDYDAIAVQKPEGSRDPALLQARERRERERRRLEGIVKARAETVKIVAASARTRVEALSAEVKRETDGLARAISLGVEHAGLASAKDQAAQGLADAREESRFFRDMLARKTGPVRIRQEAGPSALVVSPKLPVIYLGGALLALLAALGVALVVDLSSGRLRDPAEIARVAEAPFLGSVPLLPAGSVDAPSGRLLLEEVDGEASEAYRLVAATALLHGGEGEAPKVLVVTSPQAGDGKTTTAVGLAVSLARRGSRVLLVDADLRKPAAHAVLGTTQEPGLTVLFAGRSPWEVLRTVEIETPGHEVIRFDALTAGITPPNPADVLVGPRMRSFLAEARARYDAVVVDTPPATLASDASLLAPTTDGVLLVIRDRRSHRGPLRRAASRLLAVRARLRGVVLNAVRGSRRDRYGYGYGYGHGHGRRPGATGAGGAADGASAPLEVAPEDVRAQVRVLPAAQDRAS